MAHSNGVITAPVGIDGGLKTVPIQVHGQEIYPCRHAPTYQNLSPVWTQWMQEVPRLMET